MKEALDERSKPKRSLITLIYMFLGLILSSLYLFVKEPFAEIIKNIKKT